MRGDLQTTSLADLCRRLADEGSTGRVELSRPGADARVTLREGEVIMATSPTPGARLGDRLVNAGLLSQADLDRVLTEQARSNERTKLGALLVEQQLVTRDAIRVFVQEQILDAVFDLMRWDAADFQFVPGSEHTDKLPVSLPVSQVLVEVSRRQNEWDQISQRIPHLDLVPDFVVGGSSASASLEPDEFALMASIDGQRTIRELASDLGYSEFEAARVVYGLLLLGIVDVVDPDADEAEPADAAIGPELEVDLALGQPSPGGEDLDEIDVAAALEEALRASETRTVEAPEPPSPRPEVRVHVRDDGTYLDQEQPAPPAAEEEPFEPVESVGDLEDVEEPREEAAEPVEEPREEAAEPVEEPAADLERPEPEPWEMPAEELPPEPEPVTRAGADEDLPDIDQLLSEMGAFDDHWRATTPPDAETAEPPPRPPSADSVDATGDREDLGDLGDAAEERDAAETRDAAAGDFFVSPPPQPARTEGGPDEPDEDESDRVGAETEGEAAPREQPAADAREPSPPETHERGEVSEFLRELSRLALTEDQRPSGRRPPPPPDDADTAGADEQPAAPAEPPKRPREDEDKDEDGKKRRGLFGWGR